MTTRIIISGADAGRYATIEGDKIKIAKGSHRMSQDKTKRYASTANARRRFDAITTPHTTPSTEGTITLKISDINAEISRIGDDASEYEHGRKAILQSIIWHNVT